MIVVISKGSSSVTVAEFIRSRQSFSDQFIHTVNPQPFQRSRMYTALKKGSHSQDGTSSERLPLSDNSEYHDEHFTGEKYMEEGATRNVKREPRRWLSGLRLQGVCFHILLASIYGALFLVATYKTRKSIEWPEQKPTHLIECKILTI